MSNLCDSVVESQRNVDMNGPATTLLSTSSQPFRSKSSDNNKNQNSNIHSTIKSSPNQSCVLQNRRLQNEKAAVDAQALSDTPVSDLTAQCGGLNINEDGHQCDSPARKGKNAKKKESQKLLKMVSAYDAMIPPTPLEAPSLLPGCNNSLHDFFLKHVSPMYAASNSRYLENLCHHPQFQLTHQIVHAESEREPINNTHAASVPTTPVPSVPTTSVPSISTKPVRGIPTKSVRSVSTKPVLSIPTKPELSVATKSVQSVPTTPVLAPERPMSISTPSSPAVQSDLITPRFIQNALQHPLLSKSFYMRNDNLAHMFGINHLQKPLLQTANVCNNLRDVSEQNGTPKKKKNKKKDKGNDDKKFEPYLSLMDVETGLKDNTLHEGVLRINPKQFQHSYVSSSDRSEQDILIDGMKNRNRALEGDVVVVKLLESDAEDSGDENKQKKGKVVYIKERVHKRTCIGSLKLMPDKNRQKALFVPRDHRIPRLNIFSTNWPDSFYQNSEAYKDTLFLAEIIEWSDTRFALGKIIRNIGQSGDMVSETKAILAQTDLDITPFGPEVRHLFPRLDYKIPDEELLVREDCRKLCLFSIDPFNCRDIDDAVSLKELQNGNYEIGVHIADVAHFLTENTVLDQKVADKATTIYLVERAYHMLPDELCLLCSLFPGVDKLAFSVFWEITKDGTILSHRFSKTVINSCCQLAYEHAQAVLDDSPELQFPEIFNGFSDKDVFEAIKVLGVLAAIFRKKRFENGALRIDQPKVSFRLNPDGMPESYCINENQESNRMIEEFMLLANMTVARRIHDDHPRLAFLRCHPPPSGYMLRQLAKSLKPMGIHLDISSAGDLHRSLLPHVESTSESRGKAMVLNMLCAKPMTRAKYFCADGVDDDDFCHYALNVPLYTHFTSPIRRYADIMVHRLLASSLKYREVPNWDVDKVQMVAANCNKQKYNAKKAGELSTELYTLKYIENHSPVETDAAVVEVREKYIDVIIIAMGLNRRIFFNNDFPGKYMCIKNDEGSRLSKMELTWHPVNGLPEQTQIIEVFSILRVELYKGGDDLIKVETRLVRPKPTSSS